VTNEELMVQYQAGSASAFDELFEKIHQRVFSYVSRRLTNKQEVEDVVQNIFIKFHTTKEQYSTVYPLDAWIFTICRSVVYDHLRKVSKIKHEEFIEFFEDNSTELPDLDLAIATLPAQSQLIIKLKYQEDLSFEEIAQKINKSPANIRQIISRALRFLKRENEV
jgi:RNA polymerase sigma-70 factor (ECF subfamily)